jgi:hypothetical protein
VRKEQILTVQFKTSAIRRKVTEANANSYVVGELRPAYRAATEQRGKHRPNFTLASAHCSHMIYNIGCGTSKAQQAKINERVSNSTLFINIARTIEAEVNQHIEQTIRVLTDDVIARCETLRSEIELARGIGMSIEDKENMEQARSQLAQKVQDVKIKYEIVKDEIAQIDRTRLAVVTRET